MGDINLDKWNEEIIHNLIMLKYKTPEDIKYAFKENIDLLDFDEKINMIKSFLNNEHDYRNRLKRSGRLFELEDFFNDLILYIKKLFEKMEDQKTGFKSNLTDTQIINLYNQLGEFIDKKTRESDFKAALKSEPLPFGFKPVIWLVAKLTLQELLIRISGYLNKSGHRYLPRPIIRSIIPNLFCDKQGNGIALNNPKRDEYSQHVNDIERILQTPYINIRPIKS